jgi:tetratricopeptide (TPR) repeat protein
MRSRWLFFLNSYFAFGSIAIVFLAVSCSSPSPIPKRIVRPDWTNIKQRNTNDTTFAAKKAKDYVIRGSSLQMREQFAEAILEFQMALRYDSSAVIYYALAKNYAALAKFELASEYAALSVSKDSLFVPALELLADIYLNSDRIDEAISLYEKIIVLEPESKEYKFALAQSTELRNPERAAELYNQLLLDEDDEGTLYTLAQLYKRNQQYDKYLQTLERLYAVNSDSRVAYMMMNGYLRQQQFNKAIEFSVKLEQTLPIDDTEAYLQAISSTLLENSDSLLLAVTSLQNYLTALNNRHSFDWRFYYGNGLLASRIGNSALATSFFNKALAQDTTIELSLRLAAHYLQRRDFDSAIELLRKYEENNTSEARIPLFLGIAFSNKNDYDSALPRLRRAVSIDKESIDAWAQLGIVYDHLKLSDSSDTAYEHALLIDSSNALINNNYAYSLSVRGRQLNRALVMAQAAVQAQPDNSSYLDTFGWVHYQLGNFKEALEYLEKATSHSEPSATILEHLGDAYLKNGSIEQAIVAYKKALLKSPERHSLLQRLEELKK